jgi:hypothetical protein
MEKSGLAAIIGVMLVLVGVGTVHALQITQQTGGSGFPGYPPAKAKLLQREQQVMAEARKHRVPKQPNYVPPPSSPTPRPQAGIVDMHQGPFSAMDFLVNNCWQGSIGSNWVLVYVGSTVKPDGRIGQGALRLYTSTENFHLIGIYVAPNGTSALTITAVNGDLMHLHTNTGSSLIFDLLTDQYQ